jgi:hypothetical protein
MTWSAVVARLSGREEFRDPEQQDKALVVGSGLPISALVCLGLLMLYAFEGDWAETPIPAAIGVASVLATWGWVRWRSFDFVTHLMAGSMTVVFTGAALVKGDASYLALLSVVPASAAFYAAPRVGLLWSVAAVVFALITVAGLPLLHPDAVWQPAPALSYLARFVLTILRRTRRPSRASLPPSATICARRSTASWARSSWSSWRSCRRRCAST